MGQAFPLLKAAYDRGLNTWDTANVYSNGASEEIIGKAIKKYNIPRHKIVILSKCWGYVGEEPGIRTIQHGQKVSESKDYVNNGGKTFFETFDKFIDADRHKASPDKPFLTQSMRP